MASFSMRRVLINSQRVLNSSPILQNNPLRVLSSNPLRNSSIFPFTSHADNNPQSHSLQIDLSNDETERRLFNRLLYRSKQRGLLELDLILGKWVEDNIHSLDENCIPALIHVLDTENPDLWRWLSGQEQPPESICTNPVFTAVQETVMKNLDNHAAPETRATPGQPWVKGWDDTKKGWVLGSHMAGNQ